MRPVALITDAQTPLGEELVRLYLAAGYCVAATRSNQERFESPLVSEEDRLLLIDWNRTSPISARNVLLATLNRFAALDQALLLHAPRLPRESLRELSAGAIERAIDTWIKGGLFLAKGLLETFSQRGGGHLAFVQHRPAGAPPLEAVLQAAFRSTARALASQRPGRSAAGRGAVRIELFECRDEDPESPGFAAFVLRRMQSLRPARGGGCHRFPPLSLRLTRRLRVLHPPRVPARGGPPAA